MSMSMLCRTSDDHVSNVKLSVDASIIYFDI